MVTRHIFGRDEHKQIADKVYTSHVTKIRSPCRCHNYTELIQSLSCIIVTLVLWTFTDKGGVTNPLDVVIEAVAGETAVTDIMITLLAVVLCVLVNQSGIVVFVFSYL